MVRYLVVLVVFDLALSRVVELLCYHLVYVLQGFKIRKSCFIAQVSSWSVEDGAELVHWVSSIH